MIGQTPLFRFYENYGGKVVDFAGWQMPIHFGSQLDEHHAVRNDCGIFDVSHMTIVDVEGKDAKPLLRNLLANDVSKLTQTGQALYSAMLNDDGNILDDLIVYFCCDDSYRLVVNAATREKDLAWLEKQAAAFEDVGIFWRKDLAMLALQGPNAQKVLEQVSHDFSNLEEILPFTGTRIDRFFVARTGYTGEDGFEIMLPGESAVLLWEQLVKAGAKPCGLGARDTLRLEAGMNLYGTDMSEDNHPFESNMGWTVAMSEQRDFIGKAALEKLKDLNRYQLKGLVLEGKGVPRSGQEVFISEQKVGVITSGTYSPSLKKGIALVRVLSTAQGHCQVQIRNNQVDARIVKPCFVRQGKAQL